MNKTRLHAFASLHWYEECITFLFTFTAKTSELLLAAGLIVSTANFLTDGTIMGPTSPLAHAWAWAQALAIDSSLGITFYSIFHCIKQRDWIKALLYSLLTLLLAIVAGTITNVDTFSHAIHTTISDAMAQVGLDVKILTTLRAVAVVGFVMMSRLKDVSFKELYTEPATAPTSSPLSQPTEQEALSPQTLQTLFAHLTPETIEQIRKALASKGTTIITEEQQTQPLSLLKPGPEEQRNEQEYPTPGEQEPDMVQEETNELKLERAYQALLTSGERVSGRALAKRAHIHRVTCNQWLKERQQTSEKEGII
jgi:hypothetical protein